MLVAGTVTAMAVWTGPRVAASEGVVFRTVMVEDQTGEPAEAGRAAARALLEAMGDMPPKVVLVSECFEDRPQKEKLLEGICSVLPRQVVMGAATYGSFTHQGCTDFDAVALLGIGGQGVRVSTALVTEMGTARLQVDQHQQLIARRLRSAGRRLAFQLARSDRDRLLILLADAHWPKNRFLVEGVQEVLGKDFPLTGGCANKNAGQTFVYYRGAMHIDGAVGILLAGTFNVSLAGRYANEGPQVIRTAGQGAREALDNVRGRPIAVLAFNCAGRRGKLDRYEDELEAMQRILGKQVPLFGCYCAGEIGPVDGPDRSGDALCGGAGWHVMFTVVSQ